MKTITTTTIGFLATAVLCCAADRAIVIGVGAYRDPNVPRLPGIDLDVQQEENALLRLGFRSADIHKLMDSRATLANIRSEIQTWLSQATAEGDRAVFYFSGHGSLAYDANHKTVAVLIPHDTGISGRGLVNALEGPELGRLLASIRTRNVLIVADACHSGHMTDATKGLEVVPKFLQYPGMPSGESVFELDAKGIQAKMNHILLSACRRDEVAGATRTGSTLTWALSASVTQLLDDRKPVTMNSVHAQVTSRLKGATQHPELSGDNDLKEFNWARQREPQAPPVRDEPPPPPTTTSEWWASLRTFFESRKGDLALRLSRTVFQNGDTMSVDIDIPRDGYLNVVSIGDRDTEPTILFPNEYAQDSRVKAGKIKLPNSDAFVFSQEAEADENDELLAIFSTEPLNMYVEGSGKDVFRKLSPNFRGTKVKAGPGAGSGGYQAALVNYRITKR